MADQAHLSSQPDKHADRPIVLDPGYRFLAPAVEMRMSPRERGAGSLAVSLVAHAAVCVVAIAIAGRTPVSSSPEARPPAAMPLVCTLNVEGGVGDPGGGGVDELTPATPAQSVGHDALTVPVSPPVQLNPPEPQVADPAPRRGYSGDAGSVRPAGSRRRGSGAAPNRIAFEQVLAQDRGPTAGAARASALATAIDLATPMVRAPAQAVKDGGPATASPGRGLARGQAQLHAGRHARPGRRHGRTRHSRPRRRLGRTRQHRPIARRAIRPGLGSHQRRSAMALRSRPAPGEGRRHARRRRTLVQLALTAGLDCRLPSAERRTPNAERRPDATLIA